MANSHDATRPSPAPGLGWPPPPAGVFDGLADALPQGIVLLDDAGVVVWGNAAFSRLTGYGAWESAGRSLTGLLRLSATDDTPSLEIGEAIASRRAASATVVVHRKDGQTGWVDLDLRPLPGDGTGSAGQVAVLVDVTDRMRFEERLALADRMAAIGTLTAGVAHEIATPVQFVGDSVQFLRDATNDLIRVLAAERPVVAQVAAGQAPTDDAAKAVELEDEADVDYLVENVPRALDSCADGLERVGTILRSLRDYAHPQQGTMARVDLNGIVERTVTLARNEYKYVADLTTDFGELPDVTCIGGNIGQVVLILVVNAAHAVGERVAPTHGRGAITVSTRLEEGNIVHLAVSDTGTGIPAHVLPRIFEQFFTTKPVGKGTGQGLALASRIVERHGGSIDVESTEGVGTTFHVRIPVTAAAGAKAA